VVWYRRFETTYRSIFNGQAVNLLGQLYPWMGPTGSAEMSAWTTLTLLNNTENGRLSYVSLFYFRCVIIGHVLLASSDKFSLISSIYFVEINVLYFGILSIILKFQFSLKKKRNVIPNYCLLYNKTSYWQNCTMCQHECQYDMQLNGYIHSTIIVIAIVHCLKCLQHTIFWNLVIFPRPGG
jgi:hypothetical protein